MNGILDLITVTKDDLEGVSSTIRSTRQLRENHGVRQIVVDSSNEETRDKLKKLLSVEQNIDFIWQKPAGISAAFNLGLSLSDAYWVWFLNGGDQVHPDVDTNNFMYIIAQSKADAIIFDFELEPTGVRPLHPPLWALWPPVSSWIPHPATLTRQNLYKGYGMFNESYEIAMDFDFWLRCFSKQVRVDMLSIPLTKFDTSGRSYTNNAETSREAISIIKKHLCNMVRIWLINGALILKASWYHLRRSQADRIKD
jgi:glycosyltransferase involved in cell wall biosynthesis